MRQSGMVKSLIAQVGLDDDIAIPLQFSPTYGEYIYRIPGDVGVERDPCGDDALVLTWLDVARQDGKMGGKEGPPPAGCLLEFLSLGMDGRWEAPGRRSKDEASTHEDEIARQEAAREEERTAKTVLEFARKRGPLALWPYQVSLAAGEDAYRLSEPVYYYWRLARRMRTLVLLAQHLRDPDRPHELRPGRADLIDLLGRVPGPDDADLMGKLAGIVNYWMRCAKIHIGLIARSQNPGTQHVLLLPNWWMGIEWDERREGERRVGCEYLEPGRRYKSPDLFPYEDQRPSPVFAMLMMQMTALMASPQGILICAYCQRLYQPGRKPRTDGDYIRTCPNADCKSRAHQDVQNASNSKKREKAKQTSDPQASAP